MLFFGSENEPERGLERNGELICKPQFFGDKNVVLPAGGAQGI